MVRHRYISVLASKLWLLLISFQPKELFNFEPVPSSLAGCHRSSVRTGYEQLGYWSRIGMGLSGSGEYSIRFCWYGPAFKTCEAGAIVTMSRLRMPENLFDPLVLQDGEVLVAVCTMRAISGIAARARARVTTASTSLIIIIIVMTASGAAAATVATSGGHVGMSLIKLGFDEFGGSGERKRR
ncbi:hypothetical protein CPB85DRAFT_1259168 [Mucidula mucida]|nr:hypothetical protein CPB85DRAFT_1259168 [Mucidula mucida]